MKYIILCADDYGQNNAICQGILTLLSHQRLSAVSCLTNFPSWPMYGKALLPFNQKIDIGIHINLTEGLPLTMANFPSLPALITQSYLRRLDKKSIYKEIYAQIDRFIQIMEILPDFIDGHQHIHQLPIIRDIIFDIYLERNFKSYFRSTYHSNLLKNAGSLKKIYIQTLLAKPYQSQLLARNLPHNTSFTGVYPFKENKHYPTIFWKFLDHINHGGLIMCHPGESETEDRIAVARRSELDYFISDQFISDLHHSEVSMTSFKKLVLP